MPDEIMISVNGRSLKVPADCTVAAALWRAGVFGARKSVGGEPRAALCGMGICFECRATIDGRPYQRSCQVICAPGMEVRADGG